MSLFVHVLADIIHLFNLIVLCDMFFVFRRRDTKYNKLFWPIAVITVYITSVFIYLCDMDIVEAFTYVIIMVAVAYIRYKEEILRVFIVVIWMMLVLSMMDTMIAVLFNMFEDILRINGEHVNSLCSSAILLILIYSVGKVYRKNTAHGLKSIGIANLIWFTLLMAANTYVVTIIAIMNVEIMSEVHKNLYLVAIVFVIIGIFIQLAAVIILFTQRNVYKEKKALTDKYLDDQKNHYEYLENREKDTKKFRHDLVNHMEMISNLAKTRQYDRIDAYLEQMHIKIDGFGNLVTVHNGIVDAIINQYYAKAQECGVNMEVRGRFPVDCAIDAFDLCTIFSNVLSNALEAAKESDEKRISVECAYTDMSIMIIVTNSYKPEASNGSAPWRTRKSNSDYHGYGLENIKDSVKKYKGDLDIETEDNIFILRILFKNMEKQIDGNSNSR